MANKPFDKPVLNAAERIIAGTLIKFMMQIGLEPLQGAKICTWVAMGVVEVSEGLLDKVSETYPPTSDKIN